MFRVSFLRDIFYLRFKYLYEVAHTRTVRMLNRHVGLDAIVGDILSL